MMLSYVQPFKSILLYFTELDLIPAFATFICCLFWALEYGILVGVGIQVLLILYHAARPNINIELQSLDRTEIHHFLFVTLDRALVFPSGMWPMPSLHLKSAVCLHS